MKFQVPGTEGDGRSRPILRDRIITIDEIPEDVAKALEKHIKEIAEKLQDTNETVKTVEISILIQSWSYDKTYICPFCKEPNEKDEEGNCDLCANAL